MKLCSCGALYPTFIVTCNRCGAGLGPAVINYRSAFISRMFQVEPAQWEDRRDGIIREVCCDEVFQQCLMYFDVRRGKLEFDNERQYFEYGVVRPRLSGKFPVEENIRRAQSIIMMVDVMTGGCTTRRNGYNKESLAKDIASMMSMGFTPDSVAEQIMNMLGHNPSATPPPLPPLSPEDFK